MVTGQDELERLKSLHGPPDGPFGLLTLPQSLGGRGLAITSAGLFQSFGANRDVAGLAAAFQSFAGNGPYVGLNLGSSGNSV